MNHAARLSVLVPVALAAAATGARAQTCAAPSGIEPLGGGTVGTGGALALTVEGAPVPGAPFALRVEAGMPFGPGLLLLGAGEWALPLPEFGAVLHTGAPLVVLGFTLDGAGRSTPLLATAPLPAGLCGVEVVVQAAVLDPVATGAAAFTPARRIAFGTPQGASSEQFPARRFPIELELNDVPPIASGDFDQDGWPDVVALARTTGEFNVLLNQAGDGFIAAPTHSVGGLPDAFAVADVDLDGRDDVVVVDGGAAKALRLCRGIGAGSFAPTATLATGVVDRDVELGDIDGDGWRDVAALNFSAGSVVLLFGSAAGFAAPQSVVAGAQATRLAIGDVSGDGLLDLVVARPTTVTLLLNQTGRTFAAPVNLGVTTLVAYEPLVADVDGDGAPDVVVPVFSFAPGGTGVAVLRGQGGGAFAPAYVVPMSGHSAAVADVGLDGVVDLVAAVSGVDPGIAVAKGLGGGAFASPVLHRMAQGTQIAVRDFNGDGVRDVAFPATQLESVVVLAGDGAGTFRTPSEVVVYPTVSNGAQLTRWSALGDLDGDGHTDVVTVTRPLSQPTFSPIAESRFIALLGQGDGTFVKTIDVATGVMAGEVQLGDFDGDGELDALVPVQGQSFGPVPPQLRVHLGAGDGTFSAGPAISLPPFTPSGSFTTVGSITVGDVGARDGLDDFAVKVNADTVVYVATGGGNFAPFATLPLFATHPRLGDVDSDGVLDLVGAGGFGGSLSVALGTGTGFGAVQSTPAIGGGLRLGDLDGDGTLDALVGPVHPDASVQAHLGAGDGTFAPVGTYPTGIAHGFTSSADLADVDLDGALDAIVWTTESGGAVAFLRGQGDGSFADPATFASAMPAHHCAVGDLDGTGSLDVLVSGEFGPLLAAVRYFVMPGR